jgi:hypothetical protein
MTVAEGKVRKGQASSMEIVTFEINYTNQRGEHVLKARETLIVR